MTRGPLPKPPHLRQRRNISSSRREMIVSDDQRAEKFPLPKHPQEIEWHDFTYRWWDDVWDSPQAKEFLEADVGSLVRLAVIVNDFWLTGSLAVAKEIRVLEREFGLTPLARRRLEWQIIKTTEAASKSTVKSSKADPRHVLSDDKE